MRNGVFMELLKHRTSRWCLKHSKLRRWWMPFGVEVTSLLHLVCVLDPIVHPHFLGNFVNNVELCGIYD